MMNFLIPACGLLFCAISIWVTSLVMKHSAAHFEKNKRLSKANVVGYDRTERSTWYTLWVNIPELNDQKMHCCTGSKIKPSDYPVGTVVDVAYVKKTVMGISFIEARLINNPPMQTARLVIVFKCIALVILLISIIFFIIAFLKII